MYKDLFKDQPPKKDDKMGKYKDLFGESTEPEKSKETKSYNDLFANTPKKEEQPKKPIKQTTPVFARDPRHDVISGLNDKVPSNTVILWLDNFDNELKNVSATNQALAEEQMLLSQDFVKSSEVINASFTTIKNALASITNSQPTGLIGKLFNSNKPKVIDSNAVGYIIGIIKSTIAGTKCSKNIFINQQMNNIQEKINKIKLHTSCGVVACDFMLSTAPDDDRYLRAKDRLLKISKLNEMSELSLNKTHKKLAEDVDKFENLKDVTIPLLYIKLQGIINQSLDSESMNLINQINLL